MQWASSTSGTPDTTTPLKHGGEGQGALVAAVPMIGKLRHVRDLRCPEKDVADVAHVVNHCPNLLPTLHHERLMHSLHHAQSLWPPGLVYK